MRKHKSSDTKSKSDLSGERFSKSPRDQFPSYEAKEYHAPLTCIDLPITARFRLLETRSGKSKLSEDLIQGEVLSLNEEGMLISTDHRVPDEGFLLVTLILQQSTTFEGILGKIKKLECLDDGNFLVGVEFSPEDELRKILSPQEIVNLPIKLGNFKRGLHCMINSYLHKEQTVPKENGYGSYH